MRIVFEARGDGVTGLHLHPRDVGGAIVSIDRTDVWGEWPWAGPAWRDHVRTSVVTEMIGVDIGGERSGRDERTVGGRTRAAGAGRASIELDDGTAVRFVAAGDRGEGIDAVGVARCPRCPGRRCRDRRVHVPLRGPCRSAGECGQFVVTNSRSVPGPSGTIGITDAGGDDLVDHAVGDRRLAAHDEVAVDVGDDPLARSGRWP